MRFKTTYRIWVEDQTNQVMRVVRSRKKRRGMMRVRWLIIMMLTSLMMELNMASKRSLKKKIKMEKDCLIGRLTIWETIKSEAELIFIKKIWIMPTVMK